MGYEHDITKSLRNSEFKFDNTKQYHINAKFEYDERDGNYIWKMNNDKFSEQIERLSKIEPYNTGYGWDYYEVKEKLESLRNPEQKIKKKGK